MAPLKKTIYSLIDLREILLGCNRRYLEYLSALDDFSAGDRNLHRLTNPRTVGGNTLKGFNFFDRAQQALLRALQRPAFNIRGIRRADPARFLPHVSPSGMTRYLWRLRQFGLIRKVAHSYRYYLTRLGRGAIAAACRITEHTIVPTLAGAGTGRGLLTEREELGHKGVRGSGFSPLPKRSKRRTLALTPNVSSSAPSHSEKRAIAK